MIPIHELINRIRWDPGFAAAEFEIVYFDRVEARSVRIPFRDIHFDRDDHFAFQIPDEQGQPRQIPYHRVRAVYRDGERIWSRGTD